MRYFFGILPLHKPSFYSEIVLRASLEYFAGSTRLFCMRGRKYRELSLKHYQVLRFRFAYRQYCAKPESYISTFPLETNLYFIENILYTAHKLICNVSNIVRYVIFNMVFLCALLASGKKHDHISWESRDRT